MKSEKPKKKAINVFEKQQTESIQREKNQEVNKYTRATKSKMRDKNRS